MSHTTSNGASIYWAEQGAGDPVLLIMGLGASLEAWDRSGADFAKRYRVILFDNRGVGGSDVPPRPYTIEMMADDAAAVLDALGIDPAHISACRWAA